MAGFVTSIGADYAGFVVMAMHRKPKDTFMKSVTDEETRNRHAWSPSGAPALLDIPGRQEEADDLGPYRDHLVNLKV